MTMCSSAQRPETLGRLAGLLGGRLEGAAGADAVRGLADDSREVTRGTVFFARRGPDQDGASFARDAARRGAIAVVTATPLEGDLPALLVPDVDEALRRAADAFYGDPQESLDLIGITGTKGKTTTAWLTAAALRAAGRETAVLGTIRNDLGPAGRREAANTTPGVLQLRALLAEARDGGCDAAVLEVSSHGLDQGRVAGLDFRAGVFTNLGRDHLDYHRDQAGYFDAKSRLFRGLDPSATALLSAEDPMTERLAALTPARVVRYGFGEGVELRARDLELQVTGSAFTLVVDGSYALRLETPLAGRHNVLNLLAAIGAARTLGVDLDAAGRGAAATTGVPGRLERIQGASDVDAFVDYAHTEEALRAVLTFLRDVGARPLTCVVGCGGDRDRTKRPRMARAAAELSDRVVLTSDNPRTEDPEAILLDMEAGLGGDLARHTRIISDRRAAIRAAVEACPAGGCVLVAGKGHETYQILGTKKIPFDDAQVLRDALAERTTQRDGARSPGHE